MKIVEYYSDNNWMREEVEAMLNHEEMIFRHTDTIQYNQYERLTWFEFINFLI